MEKGKKILYISRYSLDQDFNLKKKFDGQLSAFKSLGYDVYFIGFDRKHMYLVHNDEKVVYGKTHFWIPSYLHTQFYNDLHKAVIKTIKEKGIDIVYWRSAPLFSSSCKVAEVTKETNAKLIIEIPTFPPNQEDNYHGIRKAFDTYSKRFSSRFQTLVDAYVVIGENANVEYLDKPAINMDNGIDVTSVPVRKPVNDKGTIHLLALASMSYWHGYERIIKSLGEYKGSQNVIIHMVGGNDGGCLPEWKELTHQLKLDDKVIFHGPLSGKDLDEMFNLCDVGINALANYKKGFSVTMELKAREYIARGLPFVCTVFDPALNGLSDEWKLQIPNDASIPDMETIIDFALKTKNNPRHVKELRSIAEKYLSWEDQYKKVIKELKGRL